MPLQDNTTLVTSSNLLIISNNNQIDTIENPTGATAFSFTNADGGLTGDDTVQNFGTNDTLLNYRQIFDGNGDGIINTGTGGILDIDRTSSSSAGPDQITLGGLVGGGLRYLGTKQGYYVYADAKVRLADFTEGTVGNDTFDASTGARSYFYDTALGLNLGGDTINGFGADDRIVTTTALYNGTDPRSAVVTGSNAVFDLSGTTINATDDNGASRGGQVDITGVNALYLQGTSTANGVTYYSYGSDQQVLNTAPTAPAVKHVTITEDTTSGAVSIGAADAEGDTLAYAVKVNEGPAKGTVSFDAAAGTFVYTPNANANGTDAFTILISDSYGGQTEQRVNMTITPVQDQILPISLGSTGYTLAISGKGADDHAAFSVSAAGDVNGDGLSDFVIGAKGNDANYTTNSGAAYVVFGRIGNQTIDLTNITAGIGGFKIGGEAREDLAGYTVSTAGDVNGDGLADILVGAVSHDSNGLENSGAAYVVFGKANGSYVDLRLVAAGGGGFKILGENAGDNAGFALSAAGDFNGDGIKDIAVGAYLNSNSDRTGTGAAYIIFGKTGNSNIELDDVALGVGGVKIYGEFNNDRTGYSIGSIGDINGDGYSDLLIGGTLNSSSNISASGSAYIVFGKQGTTAIDLRQVALGIGGIKISGQSYWDHAGTSVANAGDVNGDGINDIIIGASYNNSDGSTRNGAAYVIFGKTNMSNISLNDISSGVGGFKILGESDNSYAGAAVSAAGDLNGDGLADLLVGAPTHSSDNLVRNGAAYVVFGKKTTETVDLDNVALGNQGFKFIGSGSADQAGYSVASIGDFNGDGLTDIVVGSPYHSSDGFIRNGTAYLIYGSADWLI